MANSSQKTKSAQSGETYIELVRSVYATLIPTTIMGIVFVTASTFIVRITDDSVLQVIAVFGTLFSLARVVVLLKYAHVTFGSNFNPNTAARVERIFAIPYLSFALTLGVFCAYGMAVAPANTHMNLIALIIGYAAGVAVGVSVRPWIAVPAVLLSVVPSLSAVMLIGSSAHYLLGFILFLFLIGGTGSMIRRYQTESESITARRMFGSLARTDPLTGLQNRLGLSESFAEAMAVPQDGQVAVHCLDLDGFKPINDRFGHPAGDALLRAVSDRLQQLARNGDTAARIGGDEFVVLQTGIAYADEVNLMARRIMRTVCEPYEISGQAITISTSIGSALSSMCDNSLEGIIAHADHALYRAKASGGSALLAGRSESLGLIGNR